MKKVVILSLLTLFLINGCIELDYEAPEFDFEDETEKFLEDYNTEHNTNYSDEEVEELMEEYDEEEVEDNNTELLAAPSIDEPPTVTASADPSNLSLPNSFILTINAEDDIGIKNISFESNLIFWNHEKIGEFDCELEVTCSNSWELVTWEEGLHEITIFATDSSDQESEIILVEVDVHPYEDIEEEVVEEEEEEPECNSNSDCGYKEICSSTGSCKSVDCTTDSHCSGCKRCSSNSCVSCGSGPYGCYC